MVLQSPTGFDRSDLLCLFVNCEIALYISHTHIILHQHIRIYNAFTDYMPGILYNA